MLELDEMKLVLRILEDKKDELDRIGEFDEHRRVSSVCKKLGGLIDVKEAFRFALLPKDAQTPGGKIS